MTTKTATVRLWGEDNRLPVNPKNPRVQYVFTRGQCHSLALALHDETGWPLAVLYYSYGDEDDGGELDPSAVGDHVVVVEPTTGQVLDIEGLHPVGTGKHCAHFDGVIPVDRDTVLDLGWDRIDVESARPFAKAVVKSCPIKPARA